MVGKSREGVSSTTLKDVSTRDVLDSSPAMAELDAVSRDMEVGSSESDRSICSVVLDTDALVGVDSTKSELSISVVISDVGVGSIKSDSSVDSETCTLVRDRVGSSDWDSDKRKDVAVSEVVSEGKSEIKLSDETEVTVGCGGGVTRLEVPNTGVSSLTESLNVTMTVGSTGEEATGVRTTGDSVVPVEREELCSTLVEDDVCTSDKTLVGSTGEDVVGVETTVKVGVSVSSIVDDSNDEKDVGESPEKTSSLTELGKDVGESPEKTSSLTELGKDVGDGKDVVESLEKTSSLTELEKDVGESPEKTSSLTELGKDVGESPEKTSSLTELGKDVVESLEKTSSLTELGKDVGESPEKTSSLTELGKDVGESPEKTSSVTAPGGGLSGGGATLRLPLCCWEGLYELSLDMNHSATARTTSGAV